MEYNRNAKRPEPTGGKVSSPGGRQVCAQPNCEYFCRQWADDRVLRLRHLYAEYVDACDVQFLRPYSYSTFCAKLCAWKSAKLADEQPELLPGECMLTYWAILEAGGARHPAFVAQMVVSDATFVCRSEGRSPSDWMRCCERAYGYFGGVPRVTDCSVFGASTGGVTRCARATLEGFAMKASQWAQDLNGGLGPTDVTAASDKRVWWKADCGHVFQAKVRQRAGNRKLACPVCTGRKKVDRPVQL